jgi:NADPH-dependent curcumin reductase CurA
MSSTQLGTTNRQYRLARRPSGLPVREDWSFTTEPVGDADAGGVLVKTLALSLDPAMRGWMNEGKSYIAPVGIGEVMRAGGIGTVIASKSPAFAVGDTVYGTLGVQEYARFDAGQIAKRALERVDLRIGTMTQWLNVLGMPGMTAYFGLLDVGQPKPGETVVVSGAAGAVGQTVGQLAKIKGCRAVGIAGGPAKCEWVVKELGFDACIDYKAGPVKDGLKAHCPAASTSTSTTSAARSSTRCWPASTARRASSSAARSASTTPPRSRSARRTTCRSWSTAPAWKAWSCSTTPTAIRSPSPSSPAT